MLAYRREEILANLPAPRLSPHDPSLKDALLTADLAGDPPPEVLLVGVVPERVELGAGLSPAVRDAWDVVEDAVVGELRRLGLELTPRPVPAAADVWWEPLAGSPGGDRLGSPIHRAEPRSEPCGASAHDPRDRDPLVHRSVRSPPACLPTVLLSPPAPRRPRRLRLHRAGGRQPPSKTATPPMPPADAPQAAGHAGGRSPDRRPRRRDALLRTSATCYFGPVIESGAQAAGEGDGEPTADLLLRRTLQPEASRIVEESVRFDRTPAARPRPYTVILDVDGDAVTLTESEQRYSGSGMLHGVPWRWDSWDLTYTLTSGIRVDARCALDDGDGGEDAAAVLHCERIAYGPDGAAALRLSEDLTRISMAECESRFAAVRLPAE